MARHLSNYSIETDQTVLLTFSDGSEARTNFDKLCDYLSMADQAKVKQGLSLRRKFIMRSLGSVAKYLVIALVVVLASYDTVRAAQIVIHDLSHQSAPAAPVVKPPAQRAPVLSSTQSPRSNAAPSTPTAQSTTTQVTPAVAPTVSSTPGTSKVKQQATELEPIKTVTTPVKSIVHDTLQPLVKTVNQLTSPLGLPDL